MKSLQVQVEEVFNDSCLIISFFSEPSFSWDRIQPHLHGFLLQSRLLPVASPQGKFSAVLMFFQFFKHAMFFSLLWGTEQWFPLRCPRLNLQNQLRRKSHGKGEWKWQLELTLLLCRPRLGKSSKVIMRVPTGGRGRQAEHNLKTSGCWLSKWRGEPPAKESGQPPEAGRSKQRECSPADT